MMEEVVLLKDRFDAVLDGADRDHLAERLVQVVADLARTIRDEEDEDEDSDFKRAWDAGWTNAMDCLLLYCAEEEYADY
jgi:hypothetical protein